MYYKVVHSKEEFTTIRNLLHIAIRQYSTYHDTYIHVMVHDAQMLISDESYRYRANKRVYEYSLFLSKHCPELVSSMKSESLGIDDYRKLLAFFDGL